MSTLVTVPPPLVSSGIASVIDDVLQSTKFIDVHTHLFMPSLGALGLWGIDELVTYHYLEAELFRSSSITPDQYFKLSTKGKADVIWQALFVENSPISEATRGVVAVLDAFGLPTNAPDLKEARAFFESRNIESHIEDVLRLSGISEVVMTNDPLDPAEGPLWTDAIERHKQFHPVLRLDRILNKWSSHWEILKAQGYDVDADATGNSAAEVRRFLAAWVKKMKPVYMACSLPDTFKFPEDSVRGRLLDQAVLPACREFDLPLSLMIGVRYLVNPALKLAGDACGKADLLALEYLCREFPSNRFLVSVLSRENQHEFAVYSRKFANMLPFGCWWFLNNPSIVEEITRERIEMLGASFVPQHSDARILEQTIYKWRNTRRTLAPILSNTYRTLSEDGFPVTREMIERDVTRLFRTNFEKCIRHR
ncbi:MAG TPA: glucuronate isomerase [Bryobacteraceae bacterium]|jgi:hypothetical protein